MLINSRESRLQYITDSVLFLLLVFSAGLADNSCQEPSTVQREKIDFKICAQKADRFIRITVS